MDRGRTISSPSLSSLVNSAATFKITRELSPYFNRRTERLQFAPGRVEEVVSGAAGSLNPASAVVQKELFGEKSASAEVIIAQGLLD